MTQFFNTIIIGAGLSGAICAALLQQCQPVQVFEKARGAGGRLSSRRMAQGSADHGAPYFHASNPHFAEQLGLWRQAGWVMSWPDANHWVGTPRMSALVRHILSDVSVQYEAQVTAIARVGQHWSIYQHDELIAQADRLILAIPAPQAAALLPADHLWQTRLAQSSMSAAWVAIITLEQPMKGADVQQWSTPDGQFLAVRQNTKPARELISDTWVVYADAAWSQMHLEQEASVVMQRFEQLWQAQFAHATIQQTLVHRWRYAEAQAPLGVDFLWDESLQLGVIGDWVANGGVEGAWRSGHALAQHLLAQHASN